MIQHILLYIKVISATSIVIKDNSKYKMGEVVNETLSETSRPYTKNHTREPQRNQNEIATTYSYALFRAS